MWSTSSGTHITSCLKRADHLISLCLLHPVGLAAETLMLSDNTPHVDGIANLLLNNTHKARRYVNDQTIRLICPSY